MKNAIRLSSGQNNIYWLYIFVTRVNTQTYTGQKSPPQNIFSILRVDVEFREARSCNIRVIFKTGLGPPWGVRNLMAVKSLFRCRDKIKTTNVEPFVNVWNDYDSSCNLRNER